MAVRYWTLVLVKSNKSVLVVHCWQSGQISNSSVFTENNFNGYFSEFTQFIRVHQIRCTEGVYVTVRKAKIKRLIAELFYVFCSEYNQRTL